MQSWPANFVLPFISDFHKADMAIDSTGITALAFHSDIVIVDWVWETSCILQNMCVCVRVSMGMCVCVFVWGCVCVRACMHSEKLQRPLHSCQCSFLRGSCPQTPSKHFPIVRTMPGWDEHKDSFPSRWWASKGLESALKWKRTWKKKTNCLATVQWPLHVLIQRYHAW